MATEPAKEVNFGKSAYTDEEKVVQQSILQKKLGKEYISGWRSVELANEIFGFNGWSDRIVEITQDYMERTPKGLWLCSYSAIVRVMLKDGTYHEDIGCGEGINASKSQAIENAKKAFSRLPLTGHQSAVTDARKRALKAFGNILGNSLYDAKHLRDLSSNKTGYDTLENLTELKMMSTPVSSAATGSLCPSEGKCSPGTPSFASVSGLKRVHPSVGPSVTKIPHCQVQEEEDIDAAIANIVQGFP